MGVVGCVFTLTATSYSPPFASSYSSSHVHGFPSVGLCLARPEMTSGPCRRTQMVRSMPPREGEAQVCWREAVRSPMCWIRMGELGTKGGT